jgi:ABC-type uncharacterized transport system ATPase subunit
MKGKEAVTMWNVRKEFSSNHIRKVAVDDLSVTLYEDQITALLGHNGAGMLQNHTEFIKYIKLKKNKNTGCERILSNHRRKVAVGDLSVTLYVLY